MSKIDNIINKYLVNEDIIQYWKTIPVRARILIYPIVKLQTISGKDWEEVKNKCNKEIVLKIGSAEMQKLFKELDKVKFVSVKESPNLIVVSITDFGKRKDAEHRAYVEKKMKEPPTPIKFSKWDEEQLRKLYNGKPGNWTGD